MSEANKDNSKAILESSTIKLTRVDGFIIYSLNFKHIVMVCNALESNKWFLDWFRTQEVTIGNMESTILLEMCQVRRGRTLPLILIIFCIITKNNNILETARLLET
jgi:hypothetical protein